MKIASLKLSVAAAALLIVNAAAVSTAQNFTLSCTDISLIEFSLNAACKTEPIAKGQAGSDRGEPQNCDNQLDLSLCVGIDYTTMELVFAY